MKIRAADIIALFILLAPACMGGLWAQDGIIGVLPMGSQPVAAAINEKTSQAFILTKASQEVFVIDLRTRAVLSKYLVGGVPEGIAVNPETNYVVVASLNSAVTIIDHGRGEIVATVPAGRAPSRVAIDTKRNLALVTNFNGENMVAIDLATNKVISTIALKNGPLGIAILDNKRIAAVAQQFDMELVQINLDTHARQKSLYIGRYLSELAVNPETGMVIIGNPSSNGILTLYDPSLNSVVSTIAVGSGPLTIAIYAKKNVALVSEYNADTVSLVDLKLNRIVRTIPVAKGPSGIAVHQAFGIALVANRLNDSVTFLDIEALLDRGRLK